MYIPKFKNVFIDAKKKSLGSLAPKVDWSTRNMLGTNTDKIIWQFALIYINFWNYYQKKKHE